MSLKGSKIRSSARGGHVVTALDGMRDCFPVFAAVMTGLSAWLVRKVTSDEASKIRSESPHAGLHKRCTAYVLYCADIRCFEAPTPLVHGSKKSEEAPATPLVEERTEHTPLSPSAYFVFCLTCSNQPNITIMTNGTHFELSTNQVI
jgi:hypothetical protein